MDRTNPPLTTTSSQALTSQPTNTNDREKQISALLAKLSLHYWRPDFGPTQVKLLIGDFLADLEPYNIEQIAEACGTYRRDSANRFFPTTGKLIELIRADMPSRSSLPVFRNPYQQIEVRRASKSVAEILREKYGDRTAGDWEEWKRDRKENA